jgi:hypothetical protein
MAVEIPKIQDLYNDILSDLQTELNITIPLFGKNFLRAMAAVQAAKLKLYYLAIANIQKNVFVDLAEPQSIGGTLERFGVVKIGRLPFTAQPGSYEVSVTGTVGALIKANTTFKSNDDALNPGKIYVLDLDYTIVAGVNTIILRALEGGLDSRLIIGNELTATAPIANVDQGAVVVAETIEPLSAEDIEDYRAKVIEAYQLEPQGGAATDYRLWSADAQGVKRVYPYAKVGFPNEIAIYVEATIPDSIDSMGTPSPVLLDNVESVVEFDPDTTKPLNERGRRPLAVFNIDFNPVDVKLVDITITGFQGLTPTKQTNILNTIEARLEEIRPFVAAADIVSNRDNVLDLNIIISEILSAEPGSIFGSVDMVVGGVITGSFLFENGDIPFLNSITYA